MVVGLVLATNDSDMFIWNIIGTALFAGGAKALGILDKVLKPDTNEANRTATIKTTKEG